MREVYSKQEAAKLILEHYGQKKQELQAVQELTELILLLTARPDQRDSQYKSNVTMEIADVLVMIMQIKILHGITDDEINDVIVYKLNRQLDRIEKEAKT